MTLNHMYDWVNSCFVKIVKLTKYFELWSMKMFSFEKNAQV